MRTFEARSGDRLAQLSVAEVQAAFREAGLVVFRGYAPTPAELEAFTRPFTEQYFFGYGRAPFAEHPAITTVNESRLALEAHSDNGLRAEAMRPVITWFWCERPASAGGETTFFDGTVVWNRLAAATRELFSTHQVVYISRVAPAAWRATGHATLESFVSFLATIGARAGRIHDDQTVDVEVSSRAVWTPRWTAQPAFISSMMVAGSTGFEGMAVRLDDGRPVPPEVVADVRATLDACCEQIAWRAGDAAMLDNTRFLHGRRGYADEARRVYLVQTMRPTF